MNYLDVLYYNANFSAILWSLRKWRKIRSYTENKIGQDWDQELKKAIRNEYAQFLFFTILFIPHTLLVLWTVRNSIISIGVLESLKQNFTLVSLFVLGMILSFLYHLGFHKKEIRTNSFIETDSINEFKADNICLYLRPFAEDSYDVSDSMPHPFKNPLFGDSESLDSYISRALKNEYQIIKFASGKVGELMSDWLVIEKIENWKEKFSELLGKSSLVIVKPGFTNGLRWEINKIIESNNLNKTVFLDTYGPDRIQNLEGRIKSDFFSLLVTEYRFELSPLPKYNFWKRMFPPMVNCYTVNCGFIKYWGDIKSAVNSLDKNIC